MDKLTPEQMFPKSLGLIRAALSQAERLAIPLPKQLRTRPRDARGYPIPFIVVIDRRRQPQFTINDSTRVTACRTRSLCGICGKRLDKDLWFVGGARCFLHPRGAFVDPPSHYACAEYALRVCPFLAAPSYAKRIDDRKLPPGGLPDGMALGRVDFMPPAQPERFGLGSTRAYRWVSHDRDGVYVVDAWDYVEWWKTGEPVNAPDGLPADQPMLRNWRGGNGA
jgi:hypothetical protein